MDSDGTQDARGTHANPVPRRRGRRTCRRCRRGRPRPGTPPMPDGPAVPRLAARTPRPDAAPGVWRFGHRPRPDEEPEQSPPGSCSAAPLIAFLRLAALVAPVERLPRRLLGAGPSSCSPRTPGATARDRRPRRPVRLRTLIVVGDHARRLRPARPLGRDLAPLRPPAWQQAVRATSRRPPPSSDPAEWPELRAAGAVDAAERLAAEATRRADARRRPRPDPARLAGRAQSAGAARRLHRRRAPGRRGRLLPTPPASATCPRGSPATICSPARCGSAPPPTTPATRTPAAAPASASSPTLLGTSLLAVGPSGSGKTGHRRAARRRVAVSARARRPGRRRRRRRRGRRARPGPTPTTSSSRSAIPSPSTTSTCTAAPTTPTRPRPCSPRRSSGTSPSLTGGDSRRPPPRSPSSSDRSGRSHGRFPSVPELRELLDGAPAAAGRAAQGLEDPVQQSLLRELDARERQIGEPGRRRRAARRPGRAAGPARLRRVLRHRRQRPAVLAARPRPPAAGPHRPARARARRRLPDAGAAGARPVHGERRGARRTGRCSPAWSSTTPPGP